MSGDKTGRILCLDDEEGILSCLERHFRREKYLYLCTSDPQQALQWAREHQPEIVISDYRMEKMNGLDFIQALRKLSPDSIRVLLSGFADEDRIQQALISGDIHHFLHKPWDPKSFKENVSAWFASRSSAKGSVRSAA